MSAYRDLVAKGDADHTQLTELEFVLYADIKAHGGGACISAAATEYAQLIAERDAWRAAIQRLTPGGSEFTEPQECERYAKRRIDDQHKLILSMKAQRDASVAKLAAKNKELEEMRKDAVFMAKVWKQIQDDSSDMFIRAYGDPDGIDFVADRILAAHHEEE